MIVALLKLGVDYQSIMSMPFGEAETLLETWQKMVNPKKAKTVTYRVRRDRSHGK